MWRGVGPWRNYHKGWAAIKQYANQTACPLWLLHYTALLSRCCPLDKVLAAMYGINRVSGVRCTRTRMKLWCYHRCVLSREKVTLFVLCQWPSLGTKVRLFAKSQKRSCCSPALGPARVITYRRTISVPGPYATAHHFFSEVTLLTHLKIGHQAILW